MGRKVARQSRPLRGFLLYNLDNMKNDPHKTFLNIVRENQLEESNLAGLIKYGIDNLPDNESRPDLKLADFFFVLSEKKDLNPRLLDLFTDAFVHCNESKDFPTPTSYEKLKDGLRAQLSGLGDNPESD